MVTSNPGDQTDVSQLRQPLYPSLELLAVFPTVSEALDRPYSYVLVATKAIPEITPTPKLLAPFLSPSYTHPQPTYVLMQNGLGIERDLYNALSSLPNTKAPRILSCAVWIGTNLLSDNVVEHNDFVRLYSYAWHLPVI